MSPTLHPAPSPPISTQVPCRNSRRGCVSTPARGCGSVVRARGGPGPRPPCPRALDPSPCPEGTRAPGTCPRPERRSKHHSPPTRSPVPGTPGRIYDSPGEDRWGQWRKVSHWGLNTGVAGRRAGGRTPPQPAASPLPTACESASLSSCPRRAFTSRLLRAEGRGVSVPRDLQGDKTRALDREQPQPGARARAAADVPIYSCSAIHPTTAFAAPTLGQTRSRLPGVSAGDDRRGHGPLWGETEKR